MVTSNLKKQKQKKPTYLIPESLTTFCWKNGKLVFKKGRGRQTTRKSNRRHSKDCPDRCLCSTTVRWMDCPPVYKQQEPARRPWCSQQLPHKGWPTGRKLSPASSFLFSDTGLKLKRLADLRLAPSSLTYSQRWYHLQQRLLVVPKRGKKSMLEATHQPYFSNSPDVVKIKTAAN